MSNYTIIPQQIGNGYIGKVYQIQCLEPPHNKLIIKVFDQNNNERYNKEREILSKFTEHEYIIKLNNANIILDNSNFFPNDSSYLLFDYLEHGNLSLYLQYMENYPDISEEFVKLFCFKLLKALRIIHSYKICHSKLDILNIMLDSEFNPTIIHFSEAFIVNNINNFRKDFEGLANILATMITQGKVLHCKYDHTKKYFEITDNFKRKSRDTKFWKMYEESQKKDIKKFISFFNRLIKTKIGNIDELFNHEWLIDLSRNVNYLNEIENQSRIYFQKRYQYLFESKKNESSIKVDLNSILNEPINYNNSLFNNKFNKGECNNDEYKYNLEIRKIENEPKGILFDYIEIITNNINNNNNKEKSCIPYNFMIEFQNCIESLNLEIGIKFSKQNLSYTLTINDQKNNEIKDQKNNEIKEDDTNNSDDCQEECNDFIDDDRSSEEDDSESLIIKIELLQYNKKNDYDDYYIDKYFLMFNYIQGEIYDYYFYLKKLKEEAKNLLAKTL